MGLHCTAVGKAVAAHIPPEEVGRLVAAHGLLRHNDNTIWSLKRLKEELERVRQSGYALDDEEEEIGARCLGVPVFRDDRVVAAISVAGNTEQITPSGFGGLLEELRAAAVAISQAG
jgi:DNA-binding IclR family transcriptional regulator